MSQKGNLYLEYFLKVQCLGFQSLLKCPDLAVCQFGLVEVNPYCIIPKGAGSHLQIAVPCDQ